MSFFDTYTVAGEARDDGVWQSRIDLALSSGLWGDAARQAREDARRAQIEATFDAYREQCAAELRPVLEHSARMLREWGLDAGVTETLHEEPARMPRGFDLVLRIGKFGDRGPGKLTISATEASELVRVTLKLGPAFIGDEINEHVGTTTTRALSGDLVGGLVATLVEHLFSN